MVSHHFAPSVGRHLRHPLFIGIGQTFLEILLALLEVCLVSGIERAELGSDALRDSAAIIRIQPIVRIAHGMDVTFSAGYVSPWNFKNFGELRSIEVSLSTGLYLAVAALGDQGRKPADFQFQADQDQEVGITKLEQKTGLGLHEVRVLVALG